MVTELIRPAIVGDVDAIAAMASARRNQYALYQPVFWAPAPNAEELHKPYLAKLVSDDNVISLVAEESGTLTGFIIAMITGAPPVYDPGGRTCQIDDFAVAPGRWDSTGRQLLTSALERAADRGAVQAVVVTAHLDVDKREALRACGLSIASEWWVTSALASTDGASRVEWLSRACASTAVNLSELTRDQLASPTPCDGWQVRDLINHIVSATRFFADLAEHGSSAAGQEWPTYSDGDFAAAFGEQADRLVAAFSVPGAMDRVMALPTGPAPGSRCIQVATGEIFIHGWDLARAIGQAAPCDEGVAEALLASDWIGMCADVRDSDPSVFSPEVSVPRTATAVDRLAGFLGRDPAWRADG